MTPLSGDERRALALLAALLLLASAARWLERPRSILDDVPNVDVADLEKASRAAKDDRTGTTRRPHSRTRRSAPDADSLAPGLSEYTPPARIDPNYASSEELSRLPGVGPALAARIIAERERAPFGAVDDLRRVPGIGPSLAARLAEHLTLPMKAAPAQRVQRAPNRAPATSPETDKVDAQPDAIDLNTANAEQLQRISGVGPAIAARLLARRDSLGRFRSYDDLDSVRGIGPALLARIRAATVLR
jgi:competence ComEA-like helix-hairpin-helix protein